MQVLQMEDKNRKKEITRAILEALFLNRPER